ncbi:hypothetical protein TNCV_3202801, partial [Trichonephila clavipes]
ETHNRSILRIISCQAEGVTCGKTAPFAEKENPVSSRQRTSFLHLRVCAADKNPRIKQFGTA